MKVRKSKQGMLTSYPQPNPPTSSPQTNVITQQMVNGAFSELPPPHFPERHQLFLEVLYTRTSDSFRESQERVDLILGVEIARSFEIALKAGTGSESSIALQFRLFQGGREPSPEEYDRKLNKAVQTGFDKLATQLNQKISGSVANGQQAAALMNFISDSTLLVERGLSLHSQSGTLTEQNLTILTKTLTDAFDLARHKFSQMPSQERNALLNALRGSRLTGLFADKAESGASFAQMVLADYRKSLK